jgi:hypothetical protein
MKIELKGCNNRHILFFKPSSSQSRDVHSGVQNASRVIIRVNDASQSTTPANLGLIFLFKPKTKEESYRS